MAQYIDKAAVKAIIGRMQDCTMDEDGNFYSSSALAEYNILCDLENRLDTLEVKGVDLEKEIDKEIETRWRGEYLFTSKFRESARHFFELGLKAQKE